MTIKNIKPTTEEVNAEYKKITKDEVISKAKKAKYAFEEWKKDINKRASFLYAFASEFRKNKEDLAKTATIEMGKAIKEARAEVEKCALAIEYFADNGKIFLTDEIINTEARKSFVAFEPIGVIASLMPWNFPYWQALRFAAPSRMA